MTANVSSGLGALIEAGGRAGQEQSSLATAQFGKEPSANWFKPSSGNLSTSLASTTPSFRSSWQSVVDAWRGISRGTNGVESEEAQEAGATGTTNATVEDLALKNGQTARSAMGGSSSIQARLAAQPNASIEGAAGQPATATQLSRIHWKSGQDTATPTASTVADATTSSATVDGDRAESRSQRPNRKDPAQAANTGTPAVSPATDASGWPPFSAASPFPAQVSSEISMQAQAGQAQTGETILLPASTSALSGWDLAHTSGTAQFAGADIDAIDRTGTLTTGIAGSSGAASNGARAMRTGPVSGQRGANQSHVARETLESSQDDASEPAANLGITSSASSDKSAVNAQRESSTARIAASASKTDNFTQSELAGSVAPSGGPQATASDTAQDISRQSVEHTASRGASRGTAQETSSTATPVVPAQTALVDDASAGLRNSAATHVSATLAANHSQTAAATSAATSASDTFSALDQGTSQGTSLGSPTWTHAGGQHAEAGFQDPALGWIGVRADLNGGGVHATLVPSSADAAQTLSGHLAGLSSHLEEQQASVASLSMASASGYGLENGSGQNMQQGAEGNTQGSASQESQASPQVTTPRAPRITVPASTADGGVSNSLTHAGDMLGTHISVMA